MVTFPGMSISIPSSDVEPDNRSYLPGRIHYAGLRCRNAHQRVPARPIPSTRQVEYDHIHHRRILYAPSYVDANGRLANVQYMLWQSNLVSYAIRPPHVNPSLCSCLLLVVGGSSYQYSIDENTRSGS